jgi:hypothetical protein
MFIFEAMAARQTLMERQQTGADAWLAWTF